MTVDGFSALTPLAGGWSGRTFLAEPTSDGPGDLGLVTSGYQVVRIYDPADGVAPQVHAALHRLVRGLVPVPRVVEAVPGLPEHDRPGLLVTEFVDGERGDVLLPRLERHPARLAAFGANVGRLAAVLAGMPQLVAGRFVDADLVVEPFVPAFDETGQPADPELHTLSAYVQQLIHPSVVWPPDLYDGLLEVAWDAEQTLASVARVSLVHADLNPKNLLVDPDTLEIAALVDWEFAHAGHPFTDLGNVLRFERHPVYVEAVLAAYRARHDVAPDRALDLARCADLWALVDLAARRDRSPVVDRAHALLRAIATARDVHATAVVLDEA